MPTARRTRLQGWSPSRTDSSGSTASSATTAANDDVRHTVDLTRDIQVPLFQTTPDSSDTPTMTSPGSYHTFSQEDYHDGSAGGNRRNPHWVPRPANCFIIFRSEYSRIHSRANTGVRGAPSDKSLSRRASEAWSAMSKEEKAVYNKMAEEVRVEHSEKYPEYRFHPKRKRRQARRGGRDAASDIAMTSPVAADTSIRRNLRTTHRIQRPAPPIQRASHSAVYPRPQPPRTFSMPATFGQQPISPGDFPDALEMNDSQHIYASTPTSAFDDGSIGYLSPTPELSSGASSSSRDFTPDTEIVMASQMHRNPQPPSSMYGGHTLYMPAPHHPIQVSAATYLPSTAPSSPFVDPSSLPLVSPSLSHSSSSSSFSTSSYEASSSSSATASSLSSSSYFGLRAATNSGEELPLSYFENAAMIASRYAHSTYQDAPWDHCNSVAVHDLSSIHPTPSIPSPQLHQSPQMQQHQAQQLASNGEGPSTYDNSCQQFSASEDFQFEDFAQQFLQFS